MRLAFPPLRKWFRSRLTLRMRLALWSAVLLLGTSLVLVLFINLVARASLPRVIVAPLIATPPTVLPPASAGPITPVPFEAPKTDPQLMVKGLAIQQVQQGALRQILLISVGGILLILALGSLGIYWLSGHALHPVRELAWWVSHVDMHTLNKRFVLEGPEDDVKRLADAFNRLLDRLERSLEQQKRFVSDAAHELRTPLATLRATIEAVRSDPTATLKAYQEMSETLEKTLGRLERLTESLLILAWNEQQAVREEVFLWPMLEDVLLDMEPLAKAQAIHLHLKGDPEVVIRGDNALLVVVFRNLIENAIRYNRAGGTVTIHLAREPCWATITVEDTGIGIPEEEIAHIFDRFYRGQSARSLHQHGTGLGLALVAHIVHLHGGEIHVESTPSVGSTFTVRLPL